jgi:hypothetical protein
MKIAVLASLVSLQFVFGQDAVRICVDQPSGLPAYNLDWYYHEFLIPSNTRILSTYGGFTRATWYSDAEHDYIAQYYRLDQEPRNIDEYQLWNYDTIHESMYNREWNISDLLLSGGGILRISAPLTHFVTWNEACVTYVPTANTEAVPEPGSLALFALALSIFALVIKRESANSIRP